MKQLLLLIILTFTLFANDARLDKYPQALEWEKTAKVNADSAYNLALIYHSKIKDTNKAIEFYTTSYKLRQSSDVANNFGALYESIKEYDKAIKWYKDAAAQDHTKSMINLALLYKKLHQYDDAIFYYKKAYTMGNIGGANGLGYLYETSLKDVENAELWYKKATKKGYAKSYKNLAFLNRDRGDKIIGAAWYIALINIKYSKDKVVNYLKTKWKLTQDDLNKAYKLQQTLEIPKHYTGGIN